MRKLLSSPFTAALLGGAVVATVMLLAGVGNTTFKTVVEETSVGAQSGATGPGDGQLTASEIYARTAPGVVYITATVIEQSQSPFQLFPTTSKGINTGSGFVINRDGTILTNAHVISGAVKIDVAFANNQTVTAKVIGKDPDDDLALLRVNPDGLTLAAAAARRLEHRRGRRSHLRDRQPLRPAPLAHDRRRLGSAALDPGPQQLRDRQRDPDRRAPEPGNSGGPLINARAVIGINSRSRPARATAASASASRSRSTRRSQ